SLPPRTARRQPHVGPQALTPARPIRPRTFALLKRLRPLSDPLRLSSKWSSSSHASHPPPQLIQSISLGLHHFVGGAWGAHSRGRFLVGRTSASWIACDCGQSARPGLKFPGVRWFWSGGAPAL